MYGTGRTAVHSGPPRPHPYGALPRQPRIPKGTGEARRYLAVGLDCYLCLLAVGLLVHSCLGSAGAGRTAAVLLGHLLVLSFANQVLLTMAVRASAGKLIMGVRVIRLPDAGRPEFRRLVLRWLYGLFWLPLQPWHHLRRTAAAEPPPRERLGGGPPAAPCVDLAGVRQVHRSDLRYYRAAVEGHRG
ncbi:RDD family protein [Streptomyces sp. NPDC007346]|uniref:RDD family protein n=1 Tax=Streptomyces sp. NPDC007346 TaxID=3154682 RepID=UPI003455898E